MASPRKKQRTSLWCYWWLIIIILMLSAIANNIALVLGILGVGLLGVIIYTVKRIKNWYYHRHPFRMSQWLEDKLYAGTGAYPPKETDIINLHKGSNDITLRLLPRRTIELGGIHLVLFEAKSGTLDVKQIPKIIERKYPRREERIISIEDAQFGGKSPSGTKLNVDRDNLNGIDGHYVPPYKRSKYQSLYINLKIEVFKKWQGYLLFETTLPDEEKGEVCCVVVAGG